MSHIDGLDRHDELRAKYQEAVQRCRNQKLVTLAEAAGKILESNLWYRDQYFALKYTDGTMTIFKGLGTSVVMNPTLTTDLLLYFAVIDHTAIDEMDFDELEAYETQAHRHLALLKDEYDRLKERLDSYDRFGKQQVASTN